MPSKDRRARASAGGSAEEEGFRGKLLSGFDPGFLDKEEPKSGWALPCVSQKRTKDQNQALAAQAESTWGQLSWLKIAFLV